MTSSELIPPKSRRLDAGSVALAVAALVAIGGLAFAAGRLTAPAAAASTGSFRSGLSGTATGELGGTSGTTGQAQTPTGSFVPGTGTGSFRGGFGGAAFGAEGGLTIDGTVTAVSSSSITLKLASGTSIDVPIDSSTTYHAQTAATSADVKVGGQVSVELAGAGGTGRTFTGGAAASPAAGGTSGSTGSGNGAAGGAQSSPNPGDFLSRLGAARSITVVGP